MKKHAKHSALLTFAVILATLSLSVTSRAYHIFNTDNFTEIAQWATSEFTHDNTPDFLPDGTTPAATATPLPAPNNDQLGILYLVDQSTVHRWTTTSPPVPDGTTYNCNEGGSIYDRPPTTNIPFRGAYDGLAKWDQASVSTTAVNLQFVCDNAEIDDADVIDINGDFICDNFNEVIFDDDGSVFNALGLDAIDLQSVLGLGIPLDSACTIALSGGTNPIMESFLLMNESGSTPLDDGNLLPTMVHEIGHTLGLAHTPSIQVSMFLTSGTLNGGDAPSSTKIPTMFPFSPPAAFGPDDGDTLELDDRAAITKNYPDASINPNSFCTITGQVTVAGGSGLDGAAVVAYDTANPANEVSVIVGGNPSLSNGDYAIEFVPTGDYTVTLIPLDGSAIAGGVDAFGNVDDVFPTTASSFSQRFFDGATLETAATSVNCIGGQIIPNIDFLNIQTTTPGGGGGGFNVVDLGNSGGCQTGFELTSLGGLWLVLPAFWLSVARNRKRR